ncbi:MAG: FeoB-associated Cys-rich membrane protein [Bacteroidetes bacterium]|nr:FeoB-associated Cys-rich membrane protein [Bacteroidota bacterium]
MMTIQYIILALTIAAAFFYIGRKIVLPFIRNKKEKACGGACSGCDALKDIR